MYPSQFICHVLHPFLISSHECWLLSLFQNVIQVLKVNCLIPPYVVIWKKHGYVICDMETYYEKKGSYISLLRKSFSSYTYVFLSLSNAFHIWMQNSAILSVKSCVCLSLFSHRKTLYSKTLVKNHGLLKQMQITYIKMCHG